MNVSEGLERRLQELEDIIQEPKNEEELQKAMALFQKTADTYIKAKKEEEDEETAELKYEVELERIQLGAEERARKIEKEELQKKEADKKEFIKWAVTTGIAAVGTIVMPLVLKSINLETVRELMVFEKDEIIKSNTAKQVVGKIIGER